MTTEASGTQQNSVEQSQSLYANDGGASHMTTEASGTQQNKRNRVSRYMQMMVGLGT